MKRNTLIAVAILCLSLSSGKAQQWVEQGFGLLPVKYGVFDISIVDEQIIWAVAFDHDIIFTGIPEEHIIVVLRTLNGGESWELVEVDEAVGRASFDIEAINDSTAFITTNDFNNGKGRGVFKTTDGGQSWEEIFHDVSAGVWLRFFGPEEAIVINARGMASTKDGGVSWQTLELDSLNGFLEDEATLISSSNTSLEKIGNTLWFGTSRGRVFRSQDKGQHWEVYDTPFRDSAAILSISFLDSLNGMIVTGFGPVTELARTKDGGETWTKVVPDVEARLTMVSFIP
ncbi:MAG: hypothetical protein AAFO94_17125, partial [Bacteroidota bacterium]